MPESDDMGKLFIGGLSWDTSNDALQSYFCKFGEIIDCVVMKHKETGKSRGFGFITFKDPACVETVMRSRPHELHGRTIDPKECTPRSAQKGGGGSQGGRRSTGPAKVFLGGLPPDVTEDDIMEAMSHFGKISQVSIMRDQETKKCRGFGFLSFQSEDSVEQACGQHYVNINGKQIEMKRAEQRENRGGGRQSGGNQYGHQAGYRNGSNYQGGWNQDQQQQQYGNQGQGYGGYQSYGSDNSYAAPNSYQNPNAYSNTAPASYDQSAYAGNYGQSGSYGYAQPEQSAYGQGGGAGGYAQPAPYSQPAAAGGYAQAPAAGAYSHAAPDAKAAGGYDASFNGQAASAGRGAGYHPYRR